MLAIVYGLAILPAQEAPTIGVGDKLDHVAAFLVLTLLGRAAYWTRPAAMLAVGLSAFGAFIELSQAIPLIGRDASVADWVADSIAVLIGLALSALLARRFATIFGA